MPTSYVFKNPFASHIHPILNPDETLSILHEVNASRSAEKRLPIEILLYINDQVHTSRDALIEKIRDLWMPYNDEIRPELDYPYFTWQRPMLNLKEKKYCHTNEPGLNDQPDNFLSLDDDMRHTLQDGTIIEHISSADLLYRLRCCFPEVSVTRRMGVWDMFIEHIPSGILLKFYDRRGSASFDAFHREDLNLPHPLSRPTLGAFAADVLLLMSILHETVDGSRRLAYYHPAAIADLHSDNEQGFIAVPRQKPRRRRDEKSKSVYRTWELTKVPAADASSFESILHDFKYDVPSRKVKLSGSKDPDGVNLTTVISSALLFYRLICKFECVSRSYSGRYSHENIFTIPPITSIWQVRLTHRRTGISIIFMDDRGLFDIRVDSVTRDLVEIVQKMKRIHKMLDMFFEKIEMMEDLEALVGVLCGDNCAYES